MNHFAACLIVLCSATPALAGSTPWQDIAPDVRVRLISDDTLSAQGTTRIGLEVDMPATTNTYWRVPGETGIPIMLDFAGSEGIGGPQIDWPYPQRDTRSGYVDNVYFGPVVLPITLTADSAARVRADLTMGVCADVCTPVSAAFDLKLDFAAADAGQALRLTQAQSLAPLAWDGEQPPVAPLSFDTARQGLVITLNDPRIDPLTIIADMGADGPLFGAPQKSPDGRSVLLPVLGKPDMAGLAGQPVRLTFLTASGAYELTATMALDLSTQARW